MSKVMMYEILGVSKERAEELAEKVERILFFTTANFDEAVKRIFEIAETKEEAFLLGNLYRYYYDIIKDNLTVVSNDEET